MLFRVNAQSEVYEQALTDAGVPYQVRGGERFFARPEVRGRCRLLRGARGAGDADRRAAARRRARAVLEPARADAPSRRRRRRRSARSGSRCSRWSSWPRTWSPSSRRRTCAGSSPSSTRGPTPQHPPTVQGVTLASLHAAKGLEWDAVYLVGLVDGTLPIQHADGDDAAIEEERRLLYVGVTRARRLLSLSWALSRQPGGGRRRRPQPLPRTG